MNFDQKQKSHQPLVAGWFKMIICFNTLLSFLRRGVCPSPQGSGNLVPDRLAGSYCDFFAILVTFFFSSLFQCLFGSIFARFSTPTCLPKSTKIAQKSMPRCIPSWTPFLDRFLLDFCSQLGPPDPEKSSPRCSQSTILEKSPFQVNIDF